MISRPLMFALLCGSILSPVLSACHQSMPEPGAVYLLRRLMPAIFTLKK